MFRLRVSTLVLAVYWLAMFVATHMPGGTGPGVNHPYDKLGHAGLYGLLAFLLCWTVVGVRHIRLGTFAVLWGVAMAYGAMDEFSQQLVPDRDASLADWVADAIGSGLGLVGFFLLTIVYRRGRTADHAQGDDSEKKPRGQKFGVGGR
jgi:VanZ family protein